MGTSGNCFRASVAVLGLDEDYWEQFKGKSGLVPSGAVSGLNEDYWEQFKGKSGLVGLCQG